MSIKKLTKEMTKKQKTESREVIAKKIDLVFGKYKNGVDTKKYEKGLKKASKLLSKLVVVPIVKETSTKKTNAKRVVSIK
jgi:hypothetical protein